MLFKKMYHTTYVPYNDISKSCYPGNENVFFVVILPLSFSIANKNDLSKQLRFFKKITEKYLSKIQI